MTISGSVVDTDVRVSDFLGTCCNPEIGLDFFVEGPITYNYSFTFDAGLSLDTGTGVTLTPGSTQTLYPYLNLTSASLTASQDMRFGTSFNFYVDPPFFDRMGFSLDMPSGEYCYGGGCVSLGGGGNFTNTGSNLSSTAAAGVNTGTGEAGGWWAGADLLNVVAGTGIPVVSQVATALNGIGMDLDLGMGINILRTSALDFNYLTSLNAYTLTVPDLPAGTTFSFETTDTLIYDLFSYTNFDYRAYINLMFDLVDAWLCCDDVTLIDIPLSTWYVGSANSSWSGLQALLDLSSEEFEVGSTVGRPTILCCAYQVFNPFERYGVPLSESPVTINMPTEVPEPSTLLLLGSGLAGLALFGRRKWQVSN